MADQDGEGTPSGCWKTSLGTQPSLPGEARHRMDRQAEWTIT